MHKLSYICLFASVALLGPTSHARAQSQKTTETIEANGNVMSPTKNGTYHRSWSASEIQELDKKQRAGEALEGELKESMDTFNSYFSEELLKGYTRGGQAPDASMETYFVDENEQMISLYNDHLNENSFYENIPKYGPSQTLWGQQMEQQAQTLPPWVSAKIQAHSALLQQKITEAKQKGQHYFIWVNLASYTLRVFETSSGEEILRSRVIVGARGTQTPLFTTQIVNLKFNPDWTPPASLIARGKEYTPPGDDNPLGQVRFSTNNSQNVYLHDTNNPQLFGDKIRALSAGCIRVHAWSELAQILSGMTAGEVLRATQGDDTRFVKTPPVNVWTSYERLDINEEGRLVLFGDVYGREPLPSNNIQRDI